MLSLRALAFVFGQALSTVPFALLGVLLRPCPFTLRWATINRWTRFNLWWLEKTCGIRHRVRGAEHIPAAPAIIMCKHQSAWETLALQVIFPPHTWVLKRELLWIPFFGWGLAALEPIAIDRSSGRRALRATVQAGRRVLDAGRWIVIFPEGTRMPHGQRGNYQIGGALLARETRAVVVPVAHNAGRFWPRRGFRKYPGTIDVVIGPPIDAADKKPRALMAEVEDWIESTAAGLP